MTDNIENLLRNEENEHHIEPTKSSKKLTESKRRLKGICRSLLTDTDRYLPKKTVESIDSYILASNKVDRILYSEISSFILGIDENDRGVFSSNVLVLLQYVLDETNRVSDDAIKICVKIYDHFQLNLAQIESAGVITKKEIALAMKDEIEESHKEIKNIEKEYITILGIFAAIMLAFVGSFTFSTSVLNNVSDTNVFVLAEIALIVGLVFVILITILIDFIRDINDKSIKDDEGNPKINPVSKTAIIILLFLIIITGIGYATVRL